MESLETHLSCDATATAQMLVGASRVRAGETDTGLAILLDAQTRAEEAHFAVRSEIAFNIALGYWAKRELDTAETYLDQVDPRADIIHARALDLQAWCYTARRQYRRSAELFRAMLLRHDECNARDQAIVATAIGTLSIYAAELFDADLARFVEARAQTMQWTSGLTAQRYVTLAHQALYREFAGDTLGAYSFAAQARDHAPTVAFEVLGWSMSSAIARNAGEWYSAQLYIQRAHELLDTIDADELAGEERFALIAVAENCAPFDPERAAALCARYYGLAPIEKIHASSADPRQRADDTFISGVIAETRGDTELARKLYRRAFEIFTEIEYVRRAVITGHALLKLGEDHDVRTYLRTHLAGSSNYITAQLEFDADLARLERHPIVLSLPRAQREVVALICQGKSNREIAELRHVGEQTIKNMLTKHVFRAFGVSSRSALVSSCLGGGRRP